MTPEQRDTVVKSHLQGGLQAIGASDSEGAVREARAALEADETSVDAMLLLAHGYYLREYDEKALAILQIAKATPAGEQSPLLWMLYGLLYERAGSRDEEALAAYEKAAQIKPDYPAALTNLGSIYIKRKRYRDATPLFEKITQLQPQSAKAHTNLGSAYRGLSSDVASEPEKRDDLLRKAEREYQTASRLDPGYAPAKFNLGILYLDADPFPGADTLTRLLAASKVLAEYRDTMGANLKAGDAGDEYLAVAQKAIEKEQKRVEKKRKRDEEKKKKEEEKATEPLPQEPLPQEPPAVEPTPPAAEPTPKDSSPAPGGNP